MSILLLLALTTGVDQELYEDIRFGWQGPVQTVVAKVLDIGTSAQALVLSDAGMALGGDEELSRVAQQALISWAGSGALMMGIRALVHRPRPEHTDVHWWNSSFPSGHTTGYFSMAAVYAWHYPKLTLPLMLGGALVALSRVYQGHHYPSDVLVGSVLGTGVGLLTAALLEGEGLLKFRGAGEPPVLEVGRVDDAGCVPALGVRVPF